MRIGVKARGLGVKVGVGHAAEVVGGAEVAQPGHLVRARARVRVRVGVTLTLTLDPHPNPIPNPRW